MTICGTKRSYNDLVCFYFKIKKLITAAEKMDRDQRLSITAISELRNVLDHIMKVHSVENDLSEDQGLKTEEKKEYCDKNLDKAFAHLYRAGYDSYDIISICLIEEINKTLDCISRATLFAVIPDASKIIITPYEKGKLGCAQAKSSKDIETADSENKYYDIYENANSLLLDVKKVLHLNQTALLGYEKDRSKDKKQSYKTNFFINAVVGSIFCIIGLLGGYYLIN